MSSLRLSWMSAVGLVCLTLIPQGGDGFACPAKNSPGGMKEVMHCAHKFKFMLDEVCKPNRGLPTDLLLNLVKNVFAHSWKCIDEDYEHFLVDGAVDCFVGDNAPGAKMMCNVKKSICDKKLQSEMTACAMKEYELHEVDMAKLMAHLGHVGKLCNMLADGCYKEAKKKWKDFPALPKV